MFDSEGDKSKSGFQLGWNGFLRLYNYYQFLPYSYFVTTDGLEKNEYDSLKLYEEPVVGAEEAEAAPEDNAWAELKEFTAVEIHSLLDKLKENGWLPPEAGYELEGADGEIIGSAELAWEELKLAFLIDAELEYEQLFIDAGWKTLPIQEVLTNPDSYIHLKDNQGE